MELRNLKNKIFKAFGGLVAAGILGASSVQAGTWDKDAKLKAGFGFVEADATLDNITAKANDSLAIIGVGLPNYNFDKKTKFISGIDLRFGAIDDAIFDNQSKLGTSRLAMAINGGLEEDLTEKFSIFGTAGISSTRFKLWYKPSERTSTTDVADEAKGEFGPSLSLGLAYKFGENNFLSEVSHISLSYTKEKYKPDFKVGKVDIDQGILMLQFHLRY